MSWKAYYFWNTVNPNKSCKTIIMIIKQIGSLSKICNVIKINQTELQLLLYKNIRPIYSRLLVKLLHYIINPL